LVPKNFASAELFLTGFVAKKKGGIAAALSVTEG
jgi:hypothetical protein